MVDRRMETKRFLLLSKKVHRGDSANIMFHTLSSTRNVHRREVYLIKGGCLLSLIYINFVTELESIKGAWKVLYEKE
jgi:hypothetical protein